MKFKIISSCTQSIIESISTGDIEIINNFTQVRILTIQQLIGSNMNNKHFHVQTDFGFMQLVIQNQNSNDRKRIINQRRDFYLKNQRNQFFPIIYQEIQFRKDNQQTILIVILRELTQRITQFDVQKIIVDTLYTVFSLNNSKLYISDVCNGIYRTETSQKYMLDYFSIQPCLSQSHAVKSYLQSLITNYQQKNIKKNKIYVIQDQVFYWKTNKQNLQHLLLESSNLNWLQLCILMNISFVQQIEIDYKQKQNIQKNTKRSLASELEGDLILKTDNSSTDFSKIEFKWRNGKCLNQFQGIPIDALMKSFFEPMKVYRIRKENCLVALKQQNVLNKNAGFIIIQQSVSKVQCIEFFIIYLKFFKITIIKMLVLSEMQRIQITLQESKYIYIQFPKNFIIREDQLTVIINRANLLNCQVSLINSTISDKFLILLSNTDKMNRIRKLNLSKCKQISDYAFITLFETSLAFNLTEIDLSHTNISQNVLELIEKNLQELTILKINECKNVQKTVHFKQKNRSMTCFESVGTKIELDWSFRVKILKVSVDISVDQIKFFAKMPLQQLKIKIIQGKKQKIISFVSNLYTSVVASYTKQFCEGTAGKTLRKLDISESVCRFKMIKGLFQIKGLQQLKLNNWSHLGDQIQHVSKQIQVLEVVDTPINEKIMKILVEKISYLKSLNISSSTISSHQTLLIFQSLNREINQVIIEERQYSYQLLTYVNKSRLGKIINKLEVNMKKTKQISQKQLCMFYQSLYGNKIINFVCNKGEDQYEIARRIGTFGNNKRLIRINQIPVQEITKQKRFNYGNNQYICLRECSDISEFTHKLIRLKNSNFENLIILDLKNNRYLKKDCIIMLNRYNIGVRSIDFRNCLFTFNQVAQEMFNWQSIQEVNNGQFDIEWNDANFQVLSQKHLKFFMRVGLKDLSITIKKIKESQLIFSIMYYIVSHHKATFRSLNLKFIKVVLQQGHQVSQFWQTLFTTITLKSFSLKYDDKCQGLDRHRKLYLRNLTPLNYLKLEYLQLRIPNQGYHLNMVNLLDLRIDVSQRIDSKRSLPRRFNQTL